MLLAVVSSPFKEPGVTGDNGPAEVHESMPTAALVRYTHTRVGAFDS